MLIVVGLVYAYSRAGDRQSDMFSNLQIAFLGDAPVSSGAATRLMSWKEVSRRALLERTGEQQHQAAYSLWCCEVVMRQDCCCYWLIQ